MISSERAGSSPSPVLARIPTPAHHTPPPKHKRSPARPVASPINTRWARGDLQCLMAHIQTHNQHSYLNEQDSLTHRMSTIHK